MVLEKKFVYKSRWQCRGPLVLVVPEPDGSAAAACSHVEAA